MLSYQRVMSSLGDMVVEGLTMMSGAARLLYSADIEFHVQHVIDVDKTKQQMLHMQPPTT